MASVLKAMIVRTIAILLCLSLLPVAQVACAADLLGGSCDCAASDKCGQECGCAGDGDEQVFAEHAVFQRSVLVAPVLSLPPAPLHNPVELATSPGWGGPPSGRAPDRQMPFPKSDLPLLI